MRAKNQKLMSQLPSASPSRNRRSFEKTLPDALREINSGRNRRMIDAMEDLKSHVKTTKITKVDPKSPSSRFAQSMQCELPKKKYL